MARIELDNQIKKPIAEQDSRYVSLDLPSNFIFYHFDKLSIRPFQLPDLKKLHIAVRQNDFRTLVEVINAVIDQDAYSLIEGDFHFILAWLRLNSYKKFPFTLDFSCTDDKHILAVKQGKMPLDSLKNKPVLKSSELVVYGNSDENLNNIIKYIEDIYTEYGFYMNPRTVSDIAYLSKIEIDNPFLAASKEWDTKYASLIGKTHGATLEERITFFNTIQNSDSAPTDLIFLFDEFEKLTDIGVKELVTAKCKGCGASREVSFSIDALSFFPSN